jgi:hypothetical protein
VNRELGVEINLKKFMIQFATPRVCKPPKTQFSNLIFVTGIEINYVPSGVNKADRVGRKLPEYLFRGKNFLNNLKKDV